jgi:hypothetical protein
VFRKPPGKDADRLTVTGRSFICACLALVACVPRGVPPQVVTVELPRVSVEQAAQLIPPHVADREGWAKDVLDAIEANGLAPAPSAVCSVLAVIEQESGFQADPAVPDLAGIVKRQLDGYAAKLGPLGPQAVHELLKGKASKSDRTFEERLAQVRTERDVDLIFQDLLAYYEREYPKTYAAAHLMGELFGSTRLEDLNPVTTAGSMQVSVRFATELAEKRNVNPAQVRGQLYTRRGGVFYGTARLLAYETGYTEPIFRFADYNAGFYSSRNAALQAQLRQLTGIQIAADGDLLIYDKQGRPMDRDSQTLLALLAFRARYAPELSEAQVRRDVREEKQLDFEATDSYRALKRVYERMTGMGAPYAQIPAVSLKSPKMKKERSTEWFARSVETRFKRCQAQYEALKQG